MAGKEAVVFVLDSSPSMSAPCVTLPGTSTSYLPTTAGADLDQPRGICYNNAVVDERSQEEEEEEGCEKDDATTGAVPTRLSCAKEAMRRMVCDLMLRSKTNECGVVVIKTAETRHHLATEEQVRDGTAPFPNITELSEVARPSIDLLRDIERIQISSKIEEGEDLVRGDVCDGIIVAADALFQGTSKRKFTRKFVVFTDAEHRVKVDAEQILAVVEGLKKMECKLTVIGIDFEKSACFDKPVEGGEGQGNGEGQDHGAVAECEPMAEGSGSETDDESDTDDTDDGSKYGRDHADGSKIKSENEKLLISLAKLTGGSVIAASTMREMLESTSGRRIPTSNRTRLKLVIAPGISLNARLSLLIGKATLPSTKSEAVLLEPDGRVMTNGSGEVMTSAVVRCETHWDADDDNMEVPLDQRTNAFNYGADLIPIGAIDLEGLKMRSPISMEIKGYVSEESVPMSLQIGPSYVVLGEGRKACAAVTALSEAMHRLKHVAICRFVKSKDADPVIGALYPLRERNNKEISQNVGRTQRLFFVQIPFAGDLQTLSMCQLEESIGGDKEAAACDRLIDSCMLPARSVPGHGTPSPAIRAFYNTVMNRAIDKSFGIAKSHDWGGRGCHPLATPPELLKDALIQSEEFRKTFALKRPEENYRPKQTR